MYVCVVICRAQQMMQNPQMASMFVVYYVLCIVYCVLCIVYDIWLLIPLGHRI